jgi:hypothetical protein
MQNTFQLRWCIRPDQSETGRVLQFRFVQSVTDYGVITHDGGFRTTTTWSEWSDVPEIVMTDVVSS